MSLQSMQAHGMPHMEIKEDRMVYRGAAQVRVFNAWALKLCCAVLHEDKGSETRANHAAHHHIAYKTIEDRSAEPLSRDSWKQHVV